ncbi:MAG: DUF5317 domain-containing protein, partial [Microthrixaceae bacterium]|nr:DUF5317 domain-containing protein [Microthrixaceae bacterium]
MSALLALLPVLAAIALGIGIGLLGGGNPGNLLQWRPAAWQVAAGAIALQVVADVFDWSGVIPFILSLASVAALLYVSWMNRRIGGMVLVAVGLAMNLVPMLINGGTPVSAAAMVSSGAIEESQVGSVELTGPRHLATSKDLVRPLGAVVPLPFGLVISFGDLVSLLGVTLVTQAVLRRRQVRAGGPAPPARNPSVTLSTYQEALQTLGEGPADNTYGVEAEHVTLGASGNVRPVPMRSADSPAPLDMAGPRVEGNLDVASPDDPDLGVTVRPVPRGTTPDEPEAGGRQRRRVVPPQGDIRPAPSGLDPDTGESAIVAISSLPPRDGSLVESDDEALPDDLPPGWSRAVDRQRQPEADEAYRYPTAAARRSPAPATPTPTHDEVAEPDEPTASTPVARGDGPPVDPPATPQAPTP